MSARANSAGWVLAVGVAFVVSLLVVGHLPGGWWYTPPDPGPAPVIVRPARPEMKPAAEQRIQVVEHGRIPDARGTDIGYTLVRDRTTGREVLVIWTGPAVVLPAAGEK